MKRRDFLKRSAAAGIAVALGGSKIMGANNDIRLGVIGIGSTVKLGGKGKMDIRDFQEIPGVRVVAICDCDRKHLGQEADAFAQRNQPVKSYADFRTLLDDKDIDAVAIATPNHWHSLMTIMACQAGKDVFVQKPSSHNIFEGRKMVEAMRKYNRVVQATHGPRNSGAIEQSLEFARGGDLGAIQCVYGINYKPRQSIGKVSGPVPVPASCDYDLWCGPAPTKPLMRQQLHYDWHWDWDTGNGDIGNMGIHAMDGCRWALGKNELPKRVLSIGARLGYDDDGQTPNTMITLLDYEPAPIIFEIRGLPRNEALRQTSWGTGEMDDYRGLKTSFLVQCEHGYVKDGAAYENDGTLIRKFTYQRANCKQNFIDVVRSRKQQDLLTDAMEGHLSCGLIHMANISYRVGTNESKDTIAQAVTDQPRLQESFERLKEHVFSRHMIKDDKSLILGGMLTMDTQKERFIGPLSSQANPHLTRPYRKPFVVPEKV